MTETGLLVGWKEIAEYLKCGLRTAKRYKTKYHMPVRNFPSGKPFVIISELHTFLVSFDEKSKNQKKIT